MTVSKNKNKEKLDRVTCIYLMLDYVMVQYVLLNHPKGNVSNPSIVLFSLIVDLILRDMCVVMRSFVLVSHLNWKRSFD